MLPRHSSHLSLDHKESRKAFLDVALDSKDSNVSTFLGFGIDWTWLMAEAAPESDAVSHQLTWAGSGGVAVTVQSWVPQWHPENMIIYLWSYGRMYRAVPRETAALQLDLFPLLLFHGTSETSQTHHKTGQRYKSFRFNGHFLKD